MTCKQVESRLIDYLDGKLPGRERAVIEAHAQACSSCADRIGGFTDVFYLLDSWEGITPSPSFNARLERRIAEDAAAPWWESFIPRFVAAPGNAAFALALLVVMMIGTLVIQYRPTAPAQLAQQSAVFDTSASVDDLSLYRNLPVLEDFDVLKNFEVLQELDGGDQ
jgi:anti-sigma factor RsiW